MVEVKYTSCWSTQFGGILRERYADGWELLHFSTENGVIHCVWKRDTPQGGYEQI